MGTLQSGLLQSGLSQRSCQNASGGHIFDRAMQENYPHGLNLALSRAQIHEFVHLTSTMLLKFLFYLVIHSASFRISEQIG